MLICESFKPQNDQNVYIKNSNHVIYKNELKSYVVKSSAARLLYKCINL